MKTIRECKLKVWNKNGKTYCIKEDQTVGIYWFGNSEDICKLKTLLINLRGEERTTLIGMS